jgi:hypothetical protein
MLKLFFVAVLVATLAIGINSQLTPTPEQAACFNSTATNNDDVTENCPSEMQPPFICTNSACMRVIESLYRSCNFDFARRE